MCSATALAFTVQLPNLAPIRPDDATSPQHQVRQDAAIETVAALQMDDRRRIDRLERHEDNMIAALFGLAVAQVTAAGAGYVLLKRHTARHRRPASV